MTTRAVMVTIDCAEPRKLAHWWVDAFGGEVVNDWGRFVVARVDGVPLQLGFQQVPEPKGGKNRVHVDFASRERAAEVERLGLLGAEVVGEHVEGPLAWTVLRDPEGNEFCVAEIGAPPPGERGP